MKNLILFLLFCAFTPLLFGQESNRFCQTGTRMFTNCFTFIKGKKTAKTGTFKQIFAQDDGQIRFGVGTFKENRKSIRLKFNSEAIKTSVQVSTGLDTVDFVRITWENFIGIQDYFEVQYTNNSGELVRVESDINDRSVKIPYANLAQNKSLKLISFGQEIASFSLSQSFSHAVHVQGNDPTKVFQVETKQLKLKKKDGKLYFQNEFNSEEEFALDNL